MLPRDNATIRSFLEHMTEARGATVAAACERVLAQQPDAKTFDPELVELTAMDLIDAAVAESDVLHLAGMQRCDS
jgi:hypothetical protein